ncbi:MAG: tRNA (N(6)-L-threonylcarbamoyladenosine(37)-C(2))-methylthiotransferase MtaB [Pseudomonadota bacterium]
MAGSRQSKLEKSAVTETAGAAPHIHPTDTDAPVDVVTFGCRLNTLDSEVMVRAAERAGLSNSLLVNTCAVTGEAVRQARQTIRRAKREQPDRRIVVTGCAAQIEPEAFAEMDEVDAVIGNEEKFETETYRALPDFGVSHEEKIVVNDIMSVTQTAPHMVDAMGGRTRAFVQVQTGCDHRCTFCIIPYGRGNSRSVPMGAVVEQVRRLVDNGFLEIVITGVDITSYGGDLPGRPSLGTLVQNILQKVPDLPRLRLSSIDSIEVDEPLMDAIRHDKRLLPHLHLSLQSGDDMILKRMKRRHLRDDTLRFCDDVRSARPDIAFGADIIAGFPTETETMFGNSLSIVDEAGLTHLHVFPYSPRPGTPAAKMPQVDRRIIKERAERLREKGKMALQSHLQKQPGQSAAILVERVFEDGSRLGRTEHFTLARLNRGEQGEIIPARIEAATEDLLIAAA